MLRCYKDKTHFSYRFTSRDLLALDVLRFLRYIWDSADWGIHKYWLGINVSFALPAVWVHFHKQLFRVVAVCSSRRSWATCPRAGAMLRRGVWQLQGWCPPLRRRLPPRAALVRPRRKDATSRPNCARSTANSKARDMDRVLENSSKTSAITFDDLCRGYKLKT